MTGVSNTANISVGNLPTGSMVLWLKADSGVTTSGSNVTTWADQSGSGNNVTPDQTSDGPVVLSNIINGLPVIRFNGSTNNLRKIFTTNNPVGTFTCYVMNQATTAQSDQTQGGVNNRLLSCPTTTNVDYSGGSASVAATTGKRIPR